jgi:hypothetical protein
MLKKEDINTMVYNEYIKIKNLFNIYDFSGIDYNEPDDLWVRRAIILLVAMCELADEDKLPADSNLKGLINFADNNKEALKLKEYLHCLPGFDGSLGINQAADTEIHHEFIIMSLHRIKITSEKDIEDKCDFKLDRKYKLRKDQTGSYLTVEFEDIIILIEKRNEFTKNTFRINGVQIDNVEFHELVNLISYASHVKEINKENTQAAHFLLS